MPLIAISKLNSYFSLPVTLLLNSRSLILLICSRLSSFLKLNFFLETFWSWSYLVLLNLFSSILSYWSSKVVLTLLNLASACWDLAFCCFLSKTFDELATYEISLIFGSSGARLSLLDSDSAQDCDLLCFELFCLESFSRELLVYLLLLAGELDAELISDVRGLECSSSLREQSDLLGLEELSSSLSDSSLLAANSGSLSEPRSLYF